MMSSSDILHAKVLIVDNEEVSVLLLERLLRGAGYVSITSTTDPGEVCALHRKNGYDLILLDLAMPEMNGAEAASVLKKMMPNVHIIIFTMYSENIGRSLTSTIGVDMVLSKPDGMTSLMEAVDSVLSPGQPAGRNPNA